MTKLGLCFCLHVFLSSTRCHEIIIFFLSYSCLCLVKVFVSVCCLDFGVGYYVTLLRNSSNIKIINIQTFLVYRDVNFYN